MQKYIFLLFVSSLSLVSACNAGTSPTPTKTQKPAVSSDKTASDSNAQGSADAAQARPGIRYGQCAAGLENAVVKIGCSIPITNPNLLLYKVEEWVAPTNSFKDRTAHWIGLVNHTTSSNGYDTCRDYLVQQLNVLFVGSFKLDAADTVTVEMLAGDWGDITIWQDGDANKQVFHMEGGGGPAGRYKQQPVALPAGEYVVAVQSAYALGLNTTTPKKTDMGIAASFLSASGAVLLKTDGSDRWCGFIPNSSGNLAEYIRNLAACKKCYGGTP